MLRRIFTLGLISAALVLGNLSAQAGQIGFPANLGSDLTTGLVGTGNSVQVEGLQFSNFSYSGIDTLTGSPVPPVGSAVVVNPVTLAPGEAGLRFQAAFNAPAGAT